MSVWLVHLESGYFERSCGQSGSTTSHWKGLPLTKTSVVLISHRVLLSTNVACSLNQLFLKHGNILLQKQINRTVTEDGATSARNVKLFFKSKKNPQFQTS